ncbi:MAG TPA: helix-turn-helix transcriptional regulator [Thermoanaerobaculia bacterium]|jgi:tetratricopeptide (TPR) repeat protein
MSRPRRTPPPEPPPEGGKSPATNRAFAALVALLGLDQRQVAEILRIARRTVSAYVSGKKRLNLENFRSKCAAFGKKAAAHAEQLLVSAADLAEEEEPGQVAPVSAAVLAEIGREAERLAVKAVAEKERQLALALWTDLKKLEADHWRLVAAAAPEVRSWAFVKVVGEESERAASVDADRALKLARFALWVAEQVPGVEGWVSRVFAWAFLANALRVKGDLKAAEDASACSARLQAEPPEGRPELPEPWRLLDLEASLRTELRQLPEALRLLAQAEELAPWRGPIRARLLCKRSNVYERLGDSERSIAALREALAEIDERVEPDLFCLLQSNLADSLVGTGQAAEAEEMLPALWRMQAQLGDGLNLIRLRWLEGKIDAGFGRLDRAIEALSWVRMAFHEKRSPYDEALAGVELAELYLKKGRTAEVKRLVVAMTPVFHAEGVHAEAQKALDLFRRAVEREGATPELAGRLARYLRRAQHEPDLCFEEAA